MKITVTPSEIGFYFHEMPDDTFGIVTKTVEHYETQVGDLVVKTCKGCYNVNRKLFIASDRVMVRLVRLGDRIEIIV